jgi:Ca2+-binding EF-hand superfamily protein
LKNYDCIFKKNLDDLWTELDVDGNGYLDKQEAEPFLDMVALIIQGDRAKNYEKLKFIELFEKFDEDKNGYLSKTEMC